MNWQQWVLVAVFALNTLVTIAYIGKQRTPITPASAIATVVVNAGLTWLVVAS